MTHSHLPPLHLTTELPGPGTGPGTVVLRVTGDLDHETAPDLLDAVSGELSPGDPPAELVLDLSGVAVCDSSGLSALIVALRRTSAAGTALRLTSLPPQLLRVVKVTGLAAHFAAALDADPHSRRPAES
ncbi:STAS domain-containing protein [Streptomyces sp. NPDC005722]